MLNMTLLKGGYISVFDVEGQLDNMRFLFILPDTLMSVPLHANHILRRKNF